ncbi:MAG: hypothetical protein ACRDQT_09650, partial [Gaiellaceae bacterium]
MISITGGPSGETTATGATFTFAAASPDGFTYATCDLDGGGEAQCTSPVSYGGLGLGAHRFLVRAYGPDNGLLGSDSRAWTIVAGTPPPPPPPPPPPVPPGPTPPG